MTRKAIRDQSSALRRSPIQILNVAHLYLTSVVRHVLITLVVATIHENLQTKKGGL